MAGQLLLVPGRVEVSVAVDDQLRQALVELAHPSQTGLVRGPIERLVDAGRRLERLNKHESGDQRGEKSCRSRECDWFWHLCKLRFG